MSEQELARKSYGVKLKRGDTYVAKVLTLTPPKITRDDMDVTDHDSPDGFQEWIPGMKDGGEVPFTVHLIPTNDTQKDLATAQDTDDPEPWTIEFPTVPKLYINFNGYVNEFGPGDTPVDGVLTYECKIKVTGKPEISTDESAGLSALVVTGSTTGTLDLMPAFSNTHYSYFVVADSTDASVTVTPTAAGHTITVDGTEVTSGEASGSIDLTAGETKEITVKAWEEGAAPVVYVIEAYREEEAV